MKKIFVFNPLLALRQAAAAFALILAVAAPAAAAEAPHSTPADATPLVSVDWLKSHLHDPGLLVLDIRSAIDGGGTKAYLAGHIPGSVHSDYDKDGWRVTRHDVKFMLPSVPQLEKLIGDLGIDENSRVVVTPAGVSFTDFGSAARVYWTLKISGVTKVSILNGGVAAWKAAGLPLDRGTVKPSPAIFTATINESLLAQLNDVEKIEKSGGATLIDARPASFFRGKQKAPTVAAYGHIPGAIDVDSASFYDAKTNKLKPKAELAAIASQIPAIRPAVSYCNSGQWAATDWFVLHEVLGRQNVKLYDGSMTEWAADAHRPVQSARTKWDDLKKMLGLGS
jgi:thiosulfate/3-mercaptopyruvate sulfurtransferase